MALARDLMSTIVTTVDPELPLSEFEEILLRDDISGAPVVEGERLVGIISQSDVVRAVAAVQESAAETVSDYLHEPPFRTVMASGYLPREPELVGRRLAELRVRDAMSRRLVSVAPDAQATEVAARLIRHGIHRILVAEGEKLLGIISSLDLVQLLAESARVQARPAPRLDGEERDCFAPDLAAERSALFPGDAEVATLRSDPESGATTLLVRLPAGGRIEARAQQGPVQHFVLSGEYESEGRLFKAGTYRFLPGTRAAPISSEAGAVILAIYDATPS